MPDKNTAQENVSYIVHEGILAREERHIKRLVIALIVAIILIFASNAIWLYAWFQYDYVSTETITIDGKDGIANYIGNDGDIYNGKNYDQTDEDPGQEVQEVQRD